MAPAVVNIQPINARELEKVKPHTGEIKVQDLRVPVKSLDSTANSDEILGPKRDIIIFSGEFGYKETDGCCIVGPC